MPSENAQVWEVERLSNQGRHEEPHGIQRR